MSDDEADISLPNGGATAVDVVAASQLAKIKVQNIAGVADKSLLFLVADTAQPTKDDDDDDEIDDDDDTIVDDTRDSVSPSLCDDEMHDAALEIIEFESETTAGTQALRKFPVHYGNITQEFADVEIFLISMDSLLLELTAHNYHSWTLGGQTLVLTSQIDRLLNLFAHHGGKFKLVWFSHLDDLYTDDPVLAFLRAVAFAHCQRSAWSADVIVFQSPLDVAWTDYLHRLTPSFLLISCEDPHHIAFNSTAGAFRARFETIALDTLKHSILIVEIVGLVINVCSVMAWTLHPKSCEYRGWDDYANKVWTPKLPSDQIKPIGVDVSSIKVDSIGSVVEFWTNVIRVALTTGVTDKFQSLASVVILSAIVAQRRATDRCYLPELTRTDFALITGRRLLLSTATAVLRSTVVPLQFPVADLWDGRLIAGIYAAVSQQQEILPYRAQEEFSKWHDSVGLTVSLAVDMSDKLLDPRTPTDERKLLIDDCGIVQCELPLLQQFAPDVAKLFTEKPDGEIDAFGAFARLNKGWRFAKLEFDLSKPIVRVDLTKPIDYRLERKLRKQKQLASRWYEFFALALEGRGSNLLVDFSRIPRGLATIDESEMDNKKKGGKQLWQQNSKGGAAATTPKVGKKPPVKSKKDLILEGRKVEKDKKLIDDERQMIRFACQQKTAAVSRLEELMSKLELDDSRALCVFEQATKLMHDLAAFSGADNLNKRRTESVKLVGKLKELIVIYWDYLDERQKDQVGEWWMQLGFGKGKRQVVIDTKLTLDISIVNYQLAYGGELIDIQSDPQKDDRVAGFHPDKWQRDMLDIVDRNQSALIIAPTSAGKTFVSYYCIEKILRQSDDDLVVYVSPSKALLNQAAGSIYARFRNKSCAAGKTLFGVLTLDYNEDVTNSQVLITVPQCFEMLLMSSNADMQEVCRRIKYVIFDEVHCIGTSDDAVIWEHLLLLIRCPFLALSATIGNPTALHKWLCTAESSKKCARSPVQLITYSERYSELELSLQRLDDDTDKGCVELNPFGVYVREKLKMFDIPNDQQLTARQILDLYSSMAEFDAYTKEHLEPIQYFDRLQKEATATVRDARVAGTWLSRANLRRLETDLKRRFMQWLDEDNGEKLLTVLARLGVDVRHELAYRSQPLGNRVALDNIVALVENLRDRSMLPCICFNDDRRMCERLAQRLHDEFEKRQTEFENSDEFKEKYALKDEAKLLKEQKRKRDAKVIKSSKSRGDRAGAGDRDDESSAAAPMDDANDNDDSDPFLAQKLRASEALERFRLRGRGKDTDMYDKTVARLTKSAMKGRESTKVLLRLLERGIGFHHEGLAKNERDAVEILFRSGHLSIIFSTSTLALGINMPCKTVVFGIDTPMLTPLQFRQMSGRAGRRGFDKSGTVVFMSIPTSKIRRLLTASLSMLRGNVPFTCGFVLRLLTLISANLPDIEQPALTLLRNSFLLHTCAVNGNMLQRQMQYYMGFSLQLLRKLDLIDAQGQPMGFASLVVHLAYHEPGNLLFVYMLQKNVFHKLVKRFMTKENEERITNMRKLKESLVLVLAHIFTRVRLPRNWNPKDANNSFGPESKVFLEPLPKEFEEVLAEYNAHVHKLYNAFMQQHVSDHRLQGATFSMSGKKTDADVNMLSSDIVKPINDELFFDSSFLPAFEYPLVDHRERPIYLNAYAVDFYRHGSSKTLIKDNNILERDAWTLINDFQVILDGISSALKIVGKVHDPLVGAIDELSTDYSLMFRKAFGMKSKVQGK